MKHLLPADVRLQNVDVAATVRSDAGFNVSTAVVDVTDRRSVQNLETAVVTKGEGTGLIRAAGASLTHASAATILKVDLYGTALVLD